jgi:hypothetical protein
MKRRQAIQALLGTPALAAVPLPEPQQRPPDDSPKLATQTADAASDPEHRFFSPTQYAALEKLADLIVPAGPNRPSARDAKAVEFLDFLIAQSPHSRQTLYSNGLDTLQMESGRRYNHRFEDLTPEQAAVFLTPLRDTRPAANAQFLRAVKEDLVAATFSSREYAEEQTAAGRRAGGMGTYWFPIE